MVITVFKNPKALYRMCKNAEKSAECNQIINALSAMGTKTAMALAYEQKGYRLYYHGYVLGALKANLDTLPDDVKQMQKKNGILLDLYIKMRVDENVLDVREESNAQEMTSATEYEKKYRRLSETICGFGYNMSFIQERFEAFFPNGTHRFVLGFAIGYSETFHEIAAQSCIKTDFTDPKTQDIWKNWEFFLKRDVHEYRLDGNFLFMYHGGYNCSGDSSIPLGNNWQYVNREVYEALRKRDLSEFADKTFKYDF